jgi:trigger factor
MVVAAVAVATATVPAVAGASPIWLGPRLARFLSAANSSCDIFSPFRAIKDIELKIETEPQENRTLTLTVEVEDERVQPALRAAARRVSKDYRIPGFRPGKAPYEVVLRHYGESALYQAALEDLSQKIYKDVLEQENIEPFAPGEMDIVELKPLKLKFVVPLAPEVELGNYRDVRVEFTPPEIADQALQDELEHLREHQALLEPVERPAQLGDVVTLDAKAFMNEGENPSDFLLADEDVALLLDEKADWPMPGFAPQVVGMSVGEQRKFDLAFPDAYANESLRGKVAHFDVKAKEVKLRTLPVWDDELAKSLGDYQDLDDLRAKVRADLVTQATRGLERDYAQKVIDRLVEQATVKYPPMLLEGELDDYLKDFDRRLHEQKLTLEDYLKIEAKSKEQFREEMRPQAEARLKRSLSLGKIVELEKLTVDADEVEARIGQLSTPWGDRADDMRKVLSTDDSRQMLSLDLLTDKAVEYMVGVAKGEPVAHHWPTAAEAATSEGEAAAALSGQAEPAADSTEVQAAQPSSGEAEAAAEGQVEGQASADAGLAHDEAHTLGATETGPAQTTTPATEQANPSTAARP